MSDFPASMMVMSTPRARALFNRKHAVGFQNCFYSHIVIDFRIIPTL